jgi:hypothetical protein
VHRWPMYSGSKLMLHEWFLLTAKLSCLKSWVAKKWYSVPKTLRRPQTEAYSSGCSLSDVLGLFPQVVSAANSLEMFFVWHGKVWAK